MNREGPGETLSAGLTPLAGGQLNSVEVVQDYVQLRFDGPTLTAHLPPVVHIGSKTVSSGQQGYRDALCERIGRTVAGAGVDVDVLVVRFDDGTRITILLRDEDRTGPEAVEYVHGEQRWIA